MNFKLMESSLTSLRKKLIEKLKRKEYRHAYVFEHVKTGVAYQIRDNREAREWSQKELGRRAGDKPQNVISRLEDPDYGKLSIKTLLEIAKAFDVALLVKFVPFSRLVREYDDVSPEKLSVPEFDKDLNLLEMWSLEETQDEPQAASKVGLIRQSACTEGFSVSHKSSGVEKEQLTITKVTNYHQLMLLPPQPVITNLPKGQTIDQNQGGVGIPGDVFEYIRTETLKEIAI